MNDTRLEAIMGRLLQIGVMAAACAMLLGGIYYLSLHGSELPDYHRFHAVTHVSGDAILWAGVTIMIATPILRVIFAVVAFAIERDWLYTTVSLIVLALLASSFVA
jgi:uncharacterized membrane protein